MTSITTIPASVTSIGEGAFKNARGLTTVTFEADSSLNIIGDGAFLDALKLTSINIPAGVTSIGIDAFLETTSLTSITVNPDNTHYKDISGVLFDLSGATLLQYPLGNHRTSYTIPESVTSIDYYAFYNAYKLTTLTIPISVTSIGTFQYSGLKTVYIANLDTFNTNNNTTFNYNESIMFYDATNVTILPHEPEPGNINVYVDGGNLNSPYYNFYTDSDGNNQLSTLDNKPVLYLEYSYTFYRLNNATGHPFYISDQGYKQQPSDAISLSGDGSYNSGITGTQSFTLYFNTLDTTNSLYYYCSSHSNMVNTFKLERES